MKIKFKSLSPVPFSTAQAYFKEFFALNKTSNFEFSHRHFAKEIHWPVSYLSDLVSGRKNLTVQRALEFATHLKMNNVNKEHLLWLALARVHSDKIDAMVEQKRQVNPSPSLFENNGPQDERLLSDLLFVLRLLLWKGKKLTAAQMMDTFDIPSLSLERLQTALSQIEKKEYLQWDTEGRLINKKDMNNLPHDFDHSEPRGDQRYAGLELHRDSAMNFLKFIENPKSPSTYHTRPVAIPRGEFMPVALKLIDLRNWIDDLSKQHLEESAEPEKTSYLMQLDINLFPLTKKKSQA